MTSFGILSLRPGAEPIAIEATDDEPVLVEVLSGTVLVVDELAQASLSPGQTTTIVASARLSAAGGDAMVDVRLESENDDDDEEE